MGRHSETQESSEPELEPWGMAGTQRPPSPDDFIGRPQLTFK